MIRTNFVGFGLTALLAGSAGAQTCASYPNLLTNGTTADATQVMADFNSILTCANNKLAPLASPNFTGSVGIRQVTPAQSLDVNGDALFGAVTERVALSSFSVNFNVLSSVIYDTTMNGFSLYHVGNSSPASDFLELKTYDNTGTLITSHALVVNASGAVAIGAAPPGPMNATTFYVNGAAGGTTVWTNVSDSRLKKNVSEISGALDLVRRLRGVRFQWRAVGERQVGQDLALPINDPQVGFIAQEVATVVPEAVTTPKPGSDQVYGVKQENLVPILIEAIKEQQAEIERLQNKVAALAAVRSH